MVPETAAERPSGGVHREIRGPQAGVAPCLSNAASKVLAAGGDRVICLEPNKKETAKSEVSGSLPGSKSVARAEDGTRNLGDPADPRRSNRGNQAGRQTQRQEESADRTPGVRSLHSNPETGPRGLQTEEGSDTSTQSAQETRAVRTTEPNWQTSLRAIATKAAQDPRHRFGGLYRLLNVENLRVCFRALRKKAAAGVDGVTYQEYEKNLEGNLENLVWRLKRKSYRARLVRRKYIPKGQGKLRPLGIPTLEDKLVQYAVAEILKAIFEADFLPCSYGYRPARSAHDAAENLTDKLFYGRFEFVFEADIRGFFEHLRHDWLVKMLEHRVADGALVGLIRKWLRAGILEEDGRVIHPESGTPQGGIVSPVLSNVYLHYVLDLWFKRKVQKHSRGGCELYRYADDFVVCFGWRHEAQQFERDLTARLKHFGLELAPDKTKTIRFGCGGAEHNGRFDFLGFEFRWELSRAGRPVVKRRTAPKKLRAAVDRFTEWIRSKRHGKICDLMGTLHAKYQGHWNYYGVIGNSKSLNHYWWETTELLFKWLNRRSQRSSYTWRSFSRLLTRFQIPTPRVVKRVREGLRDLSCWAERNADELAQVNLAGSHYVPCKCESELR